MPPLMTMSLRGMDMPVLQSSDGFALSQRGREGGDGAPIFALLEVFRAQDESRPGFAAGERFHRGERRLESDAPDRHEECDGWEARCLTHQVGPDRRTGIPAPDGT